MLYKDRLLNSGIYYTIIEKSYSIHTFSGVNCFFGLLLPETVYLCLVSILINAQINKSIFNPLIWHKTRPSYFIYSMI